MSEQQIADGYVYPELLRYNRWELMRAADFLAGECMAGMSPSFGGFSLISKEHDEDIVLVALRAKTIAGGLQKEAMDSGKRYWIDLKRGLPLGEYQCKVRVEELAILVIFHHLGISQLPEPVGAPTS